MWEKTLKPVNYFVKSSIDKNRISAVTMASALDQYRAVSAAWAEGRLENVLQRQKELALLHANIKVSSTNLIKAICSGEHIYYILCGRRW